MSPKAAQVSGLGKSGICCVVQQLHRGCACATDRMDRFRIPLLSRRCCSSQSGDRLVPLSLARVRDSGWVPSRIEVTMLGASQLGRIKSASRAQPMPSRAAVCERDAALPSRLPDDALPDFVLQRIFANDVRIAITAIQAGRRAQGASVGGVTWEQNDHKPEQEQADAGSHYFGRIGCHESLGNQTIQRQQ